MYPRARVSSTSPTSSVLRPRLRGVADIYAAALAVPAVVALVVCAREGAATLSALVYGVSLVVLLVGSAVYHLPGWPLRTALWLRKLDHANIYLLIAGTATPLTLALDGAASVWLLSAMWLAAGLGIVKTFAWPRAPRKLSAALYVLMGSFTLPTAPVLRAAADEVFLLFATGGLLYVCGAVIYALRWPNPAPLVFGYHELFHVFVFSAALVHYMAIWALVT